MDPTAGPARARLARLRPDVDDPVARTARWARDLLTHGFLDLPLPGRGATPDRLAALRDIGTVDLDLARLAEAHADAAAVLADLGAGPPRPGLWGSGPRTRRPRR